MREILFRGKDPDTGRWYEGFYMALSDTTYCFEEDYDRHPDNTKHCIVFDQMTDWCLPNRHLQADVDPSTVGQYTGLVDKHGKRIFEDDVVRLYPGEEYEKTARVIMSKVCWILEFKDYWDFLDTNLHHLEIIGNIHDNPELLKEA